MKRSGSRKLAYLLVSATAVIAIVYFLKGGNMLAGRDAGYGAIYKIKYDVNLANITSRELNVAKVWLTAPVTGISGQTVITIASPEKYKLFAGENGSQELYFEFKEIGKSAVKHIGFEMEVGVAGKVDEGGLSVDQFVDDQPVDQALDLAKVAQQAASLKGDDSQLTVEKILSWLAEQESVATEKSGKEDTEGQSDSQPGRDDAVASAGSRINDYFAGDINLAEQQHTPFAQNVKRFSLFSGLARNLGLPIRAIVGFDLGKGKRFSINDVSVWAQYFDGGKWQLVDMDRLKLQADQKSFLILGILKNVSVLDYRTPNSLLYKDAAFAVDDKSIKLAVFEEK